MVLSGPMPISETKRIFAINIVVAYLTIYLLDTQSIHRNVNITLPKRIKGYGRQHGLLLSPSESRAVWNSALQTSKRKP
jgi:hypothetical protein